MRMLPDEGVTYAPRSQVGSWLRKGWRLDPSHTYDDSDWAVVMILPAIPVELTEEQIDRIARRFKREFVPFDHASNLSRASRYRNIGRAVRRYYDSRRLVQESA